jgi:hypothetical protein
VDSEIFTVIEDVRHWLWTCQLQVERLISDEAHIVEALTGATDVTASHASLARGRAFSQTAADEHFLVVAGAHVVTALRSAAPLSAELVLRADVADALEVLRNLLEHWDEQRADFSNQVIDKRRSGLTYEQKWPGGTPWSTSWGEQGWVLGGSTFRT